jgi:hypothetical protein
MERNQGNLLGWKVLQRNDFLSRTEREDGVEKGTENVWVFSENPLKDQVVLRIEVTHHKVSFRSASESVNGLSLASN